MSIEKYLNEINEEVAMEGDGLIYASAVIAILGSAIAYVVDYKRNKEERKMKLEKEKRDGEFKKNKEEYLAKNSHLKDSIIKSIKNDIKKMVNKAKIDKTILNKMKKDIETEAEDYGLRSDEKEFEILYNDESDYIEIIDGVQEVRSILHWFIEDMSEVLHAKYSDAIKYGLVRVGTGDGDEGCIYVE